MRVSALMITAILWIGSVQAFGQQENVAALQKQISEMRAMMDEMKAEIQELRQAVKVSQDTQGSQSVQKLEEDQELLSAKVDEQYQTKVESASKYRIRLSGTVLVNMFDNTGTVDNIDFPAIAVDSPTYTKGSIGGTLRQSLVGVEVFGPEIKGGKVGGDLQFDFAGGFPNAPDGVTLGLPRLRTGTVHLMWPKTTMVAGQDAPFFSPLSPSSIASIALPALAYSGNLWTWIPQIRLEHRFDLTKESNILLQGGLLDPLTGELPPYQYGRVPQAGEGSRRPASAARVAWTRRIFGHELTVGTSGYYSRQNWNFRRYVDAWAAASDWIVPFGNRLEFSGEFYRGRAIGGLGGGIGRSVMFSGASVDPRARVKGLDSTGGWAQMKFRQNDKLEWNAAYGQDSVPAKDVRLFPFVQQSYYGSSVTRNQSGFLNFIYRPRSDVLLSLEYRRIQTRSVPATTDQANQINLSMGVLF